MNPPRPPVRFALVGCGTIAATHAESLASFPPEYGCLTTCCDIVANRAEDFARRFGLRARSFEEILRDSSIDAVTFCTPSGIHAEQGAAALLAGKHVIVEKPMDVSLAACDALLAAGRESGRMLSVVSQHRFDPASVAVRETLARGDLGQVFYAEARIPWFRTQEYYDSSEWRGTWALDGGGCLMNQGVHSVDLLRWLGGPVTSVTAQMRTAAHERIEVEDILTATLTFENGAIGSLLASTAMFPGFAARVAVHGTEGSAILEGDRLHTLEIKGFEAQPSEAASAHALQVATGGTKRATEHATSLRTGAEAAAVWGASHREQLSEFIRCCQTGAAPLVSGREGRETVALVLAVYESARSQRTVALSPDR